MHHLTSLVYSLDDTPSRTLTDEVAILKLTTLSDMAAVTGGRHGDRGAAYAAYLTKLSKEAAELAADIRDGLL